MNATIHPTHATHHLDHAWALMLIVGAVAATAVAILFAMVVTQPELSAPAPHDDTSVVQGSTRDRAGVPGPCFRRPVGWHDDIAGPVPTCGR